MFEEMIKLSQTLAGNWVITTPNPEERGWETQLAEFNVGDATAKNTLARQALEQGAAKTAVTLSALLGIKRIVVESHDDDNCERMKARVVVASDHSLTLDQDFLESL